MLRENIARSRIKKIAILDIRRTSIFSVLTVLFSERMYEEQFKKWGLHKYLKRSKKDEILGRVVHAAQTQSPPPDLDINSDDLRKVLRHLNEMHRMSISLGEMRVTMSKAGDSDGFCSSSTGRDFYYRVESAELTTCKNSVTSDSLTFSSAGYTGIPQSDGHRSLSEGEQLATGTGNYQTAHALVASERAYKSCFPLDRMPAHVNSESLNLETILRNVYSSCARRSFDHDSQHGKPDQVSQIVIGPQAQFWNELKYGIYLLKISCFERAFPVLRNAGDLSSGAFTENPLAFVQELFSTLSPANTALCSRLRLSLLREFINLAGQSFGSTHPVTVLCYELQKDRGSQEVSERALSFMIDLLISIQGTSYTLTFRAQTALVRLLRRSKEYERAGAMARRLLSSSISLFGAQSILARMAARELEHVLMDRNDWQQALEVCLSIIGQPPSTLELVEPQYYDEYAVHTMEDIAKIYDNLGESESSIAWLTQAANSAWTLWGSGVATTHIIDKLVGALITSGKHDEAMFWQNIHTAGGNCMS